MKLGKHNGETDPTGKGLRATRSLTLLAAALWLLWLPCSGLAQQAPPLGGIEYYGLQKVSKESVEEALQLKEGDPVPPDRAAVDALEKRLRTVPGVQDASLNAVCCVEGKTILFVGIEEKGARTLHFRSAPKGKVRLPEAVVQAGQEFDRALQAAALQGDTEEDDSQGYALSSNPAMRSVQQRFIIYSSLNTAPYQEVLLHSADASQRALAAQVLGYANPKDQDIINDLVTAMSDADSNVRNNAMRALAARAVAEQTRVEARVNIPYEPFVRLLNSLDWTDRNKALFALFQLSLKRDPALFKSLRKEAVPALIEMAHWSKGEYGLPAFVILGRMNGLTEPEIRKAWQEDDYAKVIGTTAK